jgi:Domain of unknown function (DUF4832)/Domain of unknown function (DUF4874)
MKKTILFPVVICLLVLAGCAKQQTGASSLKTTDTMPSAIQKFTIPGTKYTYTADNSTNFNNPERGFFVQRVGWDGLNNGTTDYTVQFVIDARAQGVSVIRVYFIISDYIDRDLDTYVLTRFSEILTSVREQGFKIIPLFCYSFDQGQTTPFNATAAIMKRHLDQLTPLINANTDVIAFWDAGFVGVFGEWSWSNSSYNLLNNVYGAETNSNTLSFINKMLAVIPPSRQIALRYSRYKAQLFSSTPITAAQAFTNTARGRIGFKNDCFLCNNNGSGNYFDEPVEKAFESAESKYLIYAAEATTTVPAGANDCTTAKAELAKMHISTVHKDFDLAVINKWKNQGCYNEIARKLGYRFRLTEATIPPTQSVGTNLKLGFTVTNDGYAACYNARTVEIILRNNNTGTKTIINVPASSQDSDPRFWLPGELHDVIVTYAIPVNFPKGAYTVLLNLPDPFNSLKAITDYAIRLANINMYESSTAYNKLGNLTIN